MKEQATLQKLLRDRLAEAQVTNPRYSLRAFSKKVGVHFATLSAILNGKRIVSRKIATRIADTLNLDPQERAELLALFPEAKTKLKGTIVTGEAKKANYSKLSEQQMKIAGEWEHFAIRSLLQCENFESSAEWIAKRLNLTVPRTQLVLDRLVALGLVSVDENGRFHHSSENFSTFDHPSHEIIQKSHDETLSLARTSLYRDSGDLRDFTSVTVPVNPEKMVQAKELIRKFQDDLCDLLEEGKRTEVYRLSIQLFPLTKVTQGDSK